VRTGGLGFFATLLAVAGVRRAGAQQSTDTWYTMIRRYTLSGSTDEVVQELNTGYLPLLREQDGFVQYSVVTSPDNRVTTITVFESKDQYEAATQNEADWVQQNLSSLLPAPGEETAGDAVVYSLNTDLICDPGPEPTTTATAEPTPCTAIGCPCNGGVQNACDDGLVCCQSQMGGGSTPGGAGMCAAADACGDGTPAPCTAIGCPCNGGVQNACDDGLVCCQSQMGGNPMPGGPGMCAAEDACGDSAATPTT
jgi:hypothetical protein